MSLFKKLGKIVKGVVTGNPGAIISGVAGAAGAVIGKKASKKAAKAQTAAYEAAMQEQRNALVRAEGYQQPYRDFGSAGINSLTALNSGDYSGFNTSPDYLYARDEALSGVQGSAAARGGLFSGNAGRRLAEVAGGLASQNLNNYRNALFQQVGVGQNAAGTLTNATLNTAGNVGNSLIGAGDARASGIAGSANALTNGIDQIATGIGDYLGSKKKPVAGAASNYGYKLAPRPNYNSLVG